MTKHHVSVQFSPSRHFTNLLNRKFVILLVYLFSSIYVIEAKESTIHIIGEALVFEEHNSFASSRNCKTPNFFNEKPHLEKNDLKSLFFTKSKIKKNIGLQKNIFLKTSLNTRINSIYKNQNSSNLQFSKSPKSIGVFHNISYYNFEKDALLTSVYTNVFYSNLYNYRIRELNNHCYEKNTSRPPPSFYF